MDNVEFFTAYGPKPKPSVSFKQPTKCLQAYYKEADLKELIMRAYYSAYDASRLINRDDPLYLDSIAPTDYQDVLEVFREAEEAFDDLPDPIRDRFETPMDLLRFMDDPSNYEEAARLGLLDPEKVRARKEAEHRLAAKKTQETEVSE